MAKLIVGLILQFVIASVMAIPLQEEDSGDFYVDSDGSTESSKYYQSKYQLGSENTIDFGEQGLNQESGVIDTLTTEDELQSLRYSVYIDEKKKKDNKHFYGSQSRKFNYQPAQNVLSDGYSGLSSLLEPLTNDPELKEKAKETLDSLKNVKSLLTVEKEVSFENSEEETNKLIERNLYQQEHQKLIIEKGINNKVSSEKYDASVFREFFSKVWHFLLYTILGIVFIKLLFMFVSWQRKVNRF